MPPAATAAPPSHPPPPARALCACCSSPCRFPQAPRRAGRISCYLSHPSRSWSPGLRRFRRCNACEHPLCFWQQSMRGVSSKELLVRRNFDGVCAVSSTAANWQRSSRSAHSGARCSRHNHGVHRLHLGALPGQRFVAIAASSGVENSSCIAHEPHPLERRVWSRWGGVHGGLQGV